MANAGSELKDTIIGILKEDGRLWNNKKTEFNQRLLFDLISNYDDSGVKSILLTLRNLHLENLTQTPNNLQSVV